MDMNMDVGMTRSISCVIVVLVHDRFIVFILISLSSK